LLFSMLMIVAAIFMVKRKAIDTEITHSGSLRWFGTIPHALLVGIVTGLLGAGGGFLIVPVMTLYLSIDIKKAIGTSLAIVAINSLSGFANDLTRVYINWEFMLSITCIAIVGSILGSTLSKKINTAGLKVGFGWFIMSLGLLIITKECYQFFIQH
ncbi:MAG: sulfite exporter TauE/SafE family protein, partial [Pedobacter sp.]